jgi:GT2 family glycosyltransferase/glycosyltransferase involved in cell wall biosynthesis
MQNSVVIIILVHNNAFLTEKLLVTIPDNEQIYTLVYDNGSTDHTAGLLSRWSEEKSSHRIVLSNSENIGVVRGLNKALHYVHDHFPNHDVLWLNNDTELEPDTIEKLSEVAYSDKSFGIVGGLLYKPDGMVEHAGAYLGPMGWGVHKDTIYRLEDLEPISTMQEVEYVEGAMMFIKNSLLNEVPYFDDRYKNGFFEEVDYCYQARAHGYKVIYTPKAKALHYANATMRDVSTQQEIRQRSGKSEVEFYKKWVPIWNDFTSSAEHKILITGKVYDDWSFSIATRNLAKGLSRNGVDVAIAPEEYHDVGMGMPDWEIKQMIDKPHDYWNRAVLRNSEGDHQYLMPPGKKRIAYTVGESTVLSPIWIDQLNHVDLVLTPSQFFADVLKLNELRTEVDVLPIAVDSSVFNPNIPIMKDLEEKIKGRFVFFTSFYLSPRKAADIMFRAFAEEFTKDEPVVLVAHVPGFSYATRLYYGKTDKEFMREALINTGSPTIIIDENRIDQRRLAQLYNMADVLLFTTCAEGFGIPVIEAAACKKPAIVTNYSAVAELVTDDCGWKCSYDLVDIPFVPTPYFKNTIGGKWAKPNKADIKRLMRHVFEHRDKVKQKGENAYQRYLRFYTIENVGKLAKRLIFL